METQETRTLTGLQKASILMTSLGATVSAEVFKQLSAREREMLGAEIVNLSKVDASVRNKVLDEVAGEMRSVKNKAKEVKKDVPERPFTWLETLDSQKVSDILSEERPQSVALVITHLSPEKAATIMGLLDERMREKVAVKLTKMRPPQEDVIKTVEESLRKRLEKNINKYSETLGHILEGANDSVKASVMAAMERKKNGQSPQQAQVDRRDSAVVESVEDIVRFSDSRVREVVGALEWKEIGSVLKVASEEARDTVLRNLDEETRYRVNAELSGPVHLKLNEIDEAKERLLYAMRNAENTPEKVYA